MNTTPVSSRVHIGIFGRRNVGKSSLVNALTNQELAVVSEVPGTTTDPVYKTMELLPLGPVVMIDTAGLDDEGELGNLRIEKTYDVLRKTDIAIVVIDAADGVTGFERNLFNQLNDKKISAIGVINKVDIKEVTEEERKRFQEDLKVPVVSISSKEKKGIEELKNRIGQYARFDETQLNIIGDLIHPGDLVVLVTPIDTGAPKGRMILPQQQVIRDVVDNDAIAVVTKENTLRATLESFNRKPALVVTDSQAFKRVSEDTPEEILLTSFSILIARQKGELGELLKGLRAVENLTPGSRVLIVEGCTHHRQADDIGKVKIPRWIRQMTGSDMEYEWTSGTYFPKDLSSYDVVIHCGGCMLNKQEMQYRINHAKEQKVAITNYGMLIAHVNGVLERAIRIFPVDEAWQVID